MTVDWTDLLLGFAVGAPASLLFFLGLGWGMRLALRSRQAGLVLFISAAARIALLLGIGFGVAASGGGPWALVGYALAFFVLRLLAVLWAHRGRPPGAARQEGA